MRRALAALALSLALGSALSAQSARNQQPESGSGLQVWLMTFGEGRLYWEKYGHNALWFYDPSQGIDAAFNWGMFDFEKPGFFRELMIGDMQYWVEAFPGNDLMAAYRQQDRSVLLQRLNLSPEQARKAYERARINAREQNRYYRYDYFRDNCSTRVRDMIDFALDGALKRATDATVVDRSYRSETLRLVDDLKLTQLGIDVALGKPSDKPLSVWENAFVPSRLSEAVRGVRLQGDSASSGASLVAEERVVHKSVAHAERVTTPRYWLAYFVIGLVLAAALLGVAMAGLRSAAAEKVFRWEVSLWSVITGVLGLIVLLAWLITEHVFWFGNRNLLVFNPLSLFLAVLAPLSIWKPRFIRPAAICAVLLALLSAVALIATAIPTLGQDNLRLVLLALPPHLAVAYALWSRAGRPLVP